MNFKKIKIGKEHYSQAPSTQGCFGCVFKSYGIDATNCNNARLCLGRYRSDKQSVIFIKQQQKPVNYEQ